MLDMYPKIAIACLCFLSGNPMAVELDVQKVYKESVSRSQSLIEKFCPECLNYERYGAEASTPVSERLREVPEPRDNTLLVAFRPDLQPYVEERYTDNPGGFIGKFMDVLKERSNITVKYVWLPSDVGIRDFVMGEGQRFAFDLKASRKLMTQRSKHIFVMQEGVWIVAQKKDKKWRNVMPGKFTDHYLLQSILLMIYTSITVYVSKDLDKTRIILRLYGLFLGVGVGWLPKKWFLRSLVIVWCFTTYVIVQMYFSELTSHLTSATNKSVIEDVHDLVKSEIKILCTEGIKDFYCDIKGDHDAMYICDKCSPIIIHNDWKTGFEALLENQTGHSFAFNIESSIFKKTYNKKPFVMIPQEIVTWPSMLHVSREVTLEYLSKIYKLSNRLFEGGFMKYWLEQNIIAKKPNDAFGYEPLSMSQMKTAFIILFAGWACSFVVFIIELLVKRYRPN